MERGGTTSIRSGFVRTTVETSSQDFPAPYHIATGNSPSIARSWSDARAAGLTSAIYGADILASVGARLNEYAAAVLAAGTSRSRSDGTRRGGTHHGAGN
ncbi:MAG TPA: hypothetical protein VGA56_13125 [Opitutaceae bacterium]